MLWVYTSGTPYLKLLSCLDEDSFEFHARLQLKTSIRPGDTNQPVNSIVNLKGEVRECP